MNINLKINRQIHALSIADTRCKYVNYLDNGYKIGGVSLRI